MPKIPTFLTQARPTAEVQSIKADVQMPLTQTLGDALSPVTKYVAEQAVEEKNLLNKTEALRLENDFVGELQQLQNDITTSPIYGINQELTSVYFKDKTNALLQKYKNQANNRDSAIMFENSALSDVQKSSIKISNNIRQNLFTTADTEFKRRELSILTNAFLPSSSYEHDGGYDQQASQSFDRRVLATDLEKLYTDHYAGLIADADLEKAINTIPGTIESFEATQGLTKNPIDTYEQLKLGTKGKFSNLPLEKRIQLINRGKKILTQQLTKDMDNFFAAAADNKTIDFNLDLAKELLPIDQYTEFYRQYKGITNTATVRDKIYNASKGDVKDIIEEQNYTDTDYKGKLTYKEQQAAQTSVEKASAYRTKQMDSDPVGFIIKIDPVIESLYENYQNETDPEAKRLEQGIYYSAIIDKQKEMGVKPSKVRLLTKSFSKSIVAQIMNPDLSPKEKKYFMDSLPALFGNNNLPIIVRDLTANELPVEEGILLSTNSDVLSELILSSSEIKAEEILKLTNTTDSSVRTELNDNLKDFFEVLNAQNPGSTNVLKYKKGIQDTLYKAALIKIEEGDDVSSAADFVTKEFLKDYTIPSGNTWYIPSDVNGVEALRNIIEIKAEAVIEAVKNQTDGNYLDRFHEDDFMHYAELTNVKGLTNEKVKERITSNIRNDSKWLLNDTSTGIILHFSLADSTIPVVNKHGQKIEFFFTKQPGQDPNIDTTEYREPWTGRELELLEAADYYGEIDLDDFTTDNNIYPENNNLKDVSSVISDVLSIGSANASAFVEFENVDINFIADREGNKLIGTVPDAENSKSGVTIASGFDLGARNVNDLEGLPKNIITKLKPFLGLKGSEAVARAEELNITDEEAKIINTFAHKQSLTKLKKKWEKDSGKSFSLLSKEQATVLASVAFQYGTSFEKTDGTQMNFYTQALAGNWGQEEGVRGVYEELLDFKDRYGSRREKEAAYLKKYLDNNK